jgi:hypothetical protein
MRTRKKPDPPPPDVPVADQPAPSSTALLEEPTAAAPAPGSPKPRHRKQTAPSVSPAPTALPDRVENVSPAPEAEPASITAEVAPPTPLVADESGVAGGAELPAFLRDRASRRAAPPPVHILGAEPAARLSPSAPPAACAADPPPATPAPAANPKYRVYVMGQRVTAAPTDQGTAGGLAYYVGRTGNLPRRITQHLNAALNGDRHPRSVWLRGLIAAQQRPVVQTVASCHTAAEAAEVEAHWIRTLRQAGHPLTNAFLPDEPQAEGVINPSNPAAPSLSAHPPPPPIPRPPMAGDLFPVAPDGVPSAAVLPRPVGRTWLLGGLTVLLLAGLVGVVLLGPAVFQRLAPTRPPRLISQVVPTPAPDLPMVPPALTATSVPAPTLAVDGQAAAQPAAPTMPPSSTLSNSGTHPPPAALITPLRTPNPAIPAPPWTTEDTASAVPPARLDPPPPAAAFQQNTTYPVPAGTRLIHLGETWASAADAAGVTVAELQAANPAHPLGAPLFAGEVINIPSARGGGP